MTSWRVYDSRVVSSAPMEEMSRNAWGLESWSLVHQGRLGQAVRGSGDVVLVSGKAWIEGG